MKTLQNNIRYLRKKKGMTQQEFAEFLGITRSALGAYEEGRARPGFDLLDRLCEAFGFTLDALVRSDLSHISSREMRQGDKKMKVLAITVDEQGSEYIDLVPLKAAAGYLNGYADPEFVEELPRFRLPILAPGTYRAFEISGDSMLPVQHGSIIIGAYVESAGHIRNGRTYIVVSRREGVVYKRLFDQRDKDGTLILQSDNPGYPPYSIPADEVLELWEARAYITTVLPNYELSLEKLRDMVMDLQQELIHLKKN